MRAGTTVVMAIFLGLFLCGSNLAFAQSIEDLSPTQQARLLELIDAGESSYKNGEFEAALEAYERAYEIHADPGLLYRIALTNERLGRAKVALRTYREYLRQRPDAEKRGQIERTIESLEASVSATDSVTLTVSVDAPNAAITVTDQATQQRVASGPSPLKTPLSPGLYIVEARAPGFQDKTEEVVVEGSDLSALIALEKSSSHRQDSLVLPVVSTATAAVLMGGLAVSLGLYLNASSDLEGIRDNPPEFGRGEAEDAAGRANLWQTMAWGLGAACAVAIGWSIYEWTSRDGSERSSVQLRPGGIDLVVDF